MLARWAVTVWGSWLATLALAATMTASQVRDPSPILLLGPMALMVAASIGLVVASTARLIRGPRRERAAASLLAGTAPLWFVAGHVLMAIRPAFDRDVPLGWPSRVLLTPGRALAGLQARWSYPELTPGKWVTMVGARTEDARAQVAAMDRHVDAVLARLDRSATWPITWYRGPLLFLRHCAIDDMALGSEVGRWPPGADGLTDLDRHEVAHCVITRHCTGRSDPPRVLMEGWAQANQGTTAEELAHAARVDREEGRSPTLRQLVAPDWYWYSGPAAYDLGGPLVNYLLRAYGPERFLTLYTTCQQATFDADCRATLGVGLDELDDAFRADAERVARRAGPPARRWLAGLELDPGIDPAAWDAFLQAYFAAAARLVAPYDHVRMRTTFRIERGTEAGRDDPYEYEERLALLRSGPFALVRQRVEGTSESASLIHPDRSLRASRNLGPGPGPWTLQAHRRGPGKVESDDSDRNAFIATHGGAALLQFPRILQQEGVLPDLEVARLATSTDDGHRLLTLGLRSPPGAREADRLALTLAFAVDDSFVVRSGHYERPEQRLVSDCRFEYDHPDGRPVLRSSVTTIEGRARTIRLDVEECVFGPIPAAEFDLEAFLAGLGPGEVIRERVVDPATLLGWYWLAFVVGGIGLASGSVLAMRARRPGIASSQAR